MAFASKTRGVLIALCAAGYAAAGAAPSPPVSPSTQTATGAAVSIELRSHVKLSQAPVRLGDIAFLTTRNLPMLRQLMALPIGTAPRPGSPVTLDRDTIARWVETRSGLQALDGASSGRSPLIRWEGAEETEIESASQQLPGEIIADAARSVLLRWLAERSVRANVQAASAARDLMLPAGVPMLRVRSLAKQAMPSKRMLVWVDAWVDDRFVRTTAVTFEVDAWAPLTVAAAGMDSGAVIDGIVLAGAMEKREVDLTTVKRGTPAAIALDGPSSFASNKPQRLRRPLRAGEVLTDSHLQPEPVVTRGNWANLQSRSGAVSVESRVEVLQDGRQGQIVRVKVPGSRAEVLARVTGRGQVEVQP
ncbi:flagellar basal body P-ring formation chaperone FlgA [Variovorax paradoxus]|uniref:flagellar basal body P-ring formation chaperone FlgA n=1 Tax=Variovorax paradoxus TaxID=34073 RepID=UPI00278175C2|nr:flagellar basal body P-ring formation chaperone FlgA [Variovorax paradoxus]MDP9933655.1 flagella basal body P-ring formation protein FlgA [Variovorax paradoxus]